MTSVIYIRVAVRNIAAAKSQAWTLILSNTIQYTVYRYSVDFISLFYLFENLPFFYNSRKNYSILKTILLFKFIIS